MQSLIQSAIVILFVALTSWIGHTTYTTSVEVFRLNEKFSGFIKLETEIQSNLERRCDDTEKRLAELEKAVSRIEAVVVREHSGIRLHRSPNDLMQPGIVHSHKN